MANDMNQCRDGTSKLMRCQEPRASSSPEAQSGASWPPRFTTIGDMIPMEHAIANALLRKGLFGERRPSILPDLAGEYLGA